MDVVVLDIGMPVLDGLQLLSLLRHRDPDQTIVMLTGQASDESLQRALDQGAALFLKKPEKARTSSRRPSSLWTCWRKRRLRSIPRPQVAGGSPRGAAVRMPGLALVHPRNLHRQGARVDIHLRRHDRSCRFRQVAWPKSSFSQAPSKSSTIGVARRSGRDWA